MTKFFIKVTLMSLVLSLSFSITPLLAAQGTNDEIKAQQDAFKAFYGADTLGKAVSAGYMGNTSNPRPSGNGVLPSLAPGIWTCVYVNNACVDKILGDPFGAAVSETRKGIGQ